MKKSALSGVTGGDGNPVLDSPLSVGKHDCVAINEYQVSLAFYLSQAIF